LGCFSRCIVVRAGIALGLAGRFSEVAAALQALLESGPPSAVICAKLGFVHRQMGSLELAIQYFNEALRLDQHEPVALSQMAEIRAIHGRMDKAEQYLARLEQVDGCEEEANRLARRLGIRKHLEALQGRRATRWNCPAML
jgi:eukaryotic-like serine/threonine-protein kinase